MTILKKFLRIGLTSRYFLNNNKIYPWLACNSSHLSTFKISNFEHQYKRNLKYVLGIAGFVVGLAYYERKQGKGVLALERPEVGARLDHLPNFSMAEVSRHSQAGGELGVWVVYKSGVYDITRFIEQHPGGGKILMAAGGSVEPFWQIYGVHKQEHILSMLEQYRIGNVDEKEELGGESETTAKDDPYSREPARHPALRASSVRPFNAEPPPEILVDSFITPQEVFYVRNHLPVPEVDPASYQLEVSGPGFKAKSFTLDELKKLPKYSVTAAIQCAGNRRSEMSQVQKQADIPVIGGFIRSTAALEADSNEVPPPKVKEVKGLGWGHAVIGNAVWSGVRLSDLLRHLGVKPEGHTARHLHLEGLDCDPSGSPYAASIPLEVALDPRRDVLLAYEMNGQPLSRDHGFPLRAVVPGIVGARNVKWLGRIVLSECESDSHWQQNDYKGFCPSTDWSNVDWDSAPAIQELPVNSAICSPVQGEVVTLTSDRTILVKGYAWSGGGRGIVRVDVTLDGGKTWQPAELSQREPLTFAKNWAWTLWTARLTVPPQTQAVEIWAKAVDNSYNTQPETFSNIWNLRGVLSNAYHRVKVIVS